MRPKIHTTVLSSTILMANNGAIPESKEPVFPNITADSREMLPHFINRMPEPVHNYLTQKYDCNSVGIEYFASHKQWNMAECAQLWELVEKYPGDLTYDPGFCEFRAYTREKTTKRHQAWASLELYLNKKLPKDVKEKLRTYFKLSLNIEPPGVLSELTGRGLFTSTRVVKLISALEAIAPEHNDLINLAKRYHNTYLCINSGDVLPESITTVEPVPKKFTHSGSVDNLAKHNISLCNQSPLIWNVVVDLQDDTGYSNKVMELKSEQDLTLFETNYLASYCITLQNAAVKYKLIRDPNDEQHKHSVAIVFMLFERMQQGEPLFLTQSINRKPLVSDAKLAAIIDPNMQLQMVELNSNGVNSLDSSVNNSKVDNANGLSAKFAVVFKQLQDSLPSDILRYLIIHQSLPINLAPREVLPELRSRNLFTETNVSSVLAFLTKNGYSENKGVAALQSYYNAYLKN